MHTQVVHNAYTPKETVEICSRAGVIKANMRIDKIVISSFMAGCLLAFACAVSLSTNSSPWYQENAPGLIRMIGAVIFPFGLCTIVLTGADLCTGSFMFTTISVLHRRLSVVKMLMHWTVTFFGNLAGSLFVMALVIGYGGVFDLEPYKSEVFTFNEKKVIAPQWHMIFLRGVGANWLVCLACFLGMMARELFSKVVGIWWPTFAFVALGLDHVVANMFFVPMAIFLGSPDISVGYYIWKSMIPAFIGNVVGGGLFVGVAYWYLNLMGETKPVLIDGEPFEADRPLLEGQGSDAPTPNRRPSSNDDKKSAENVV